ncbi:MAG: hypothetical protein GIX03_05060 [Candidatus Eremiobacteraeota bacterium]|nr:hypothetical protein [Candidatus Eremiobacteraeota bacterium]MBC5802366.1 hypothetical protein [Candidatus Eremiobacteraeota bacterium]
MSLTDSKLRVALGDALDPAFARDALRSGLDPQNYAAHSLRSGFATSATRANKSETAIMRQGRWKSIPVRAATFAQVPAGTTMQAPASDSSVGNTPS